MLFSWNQTFILSAFLIFMIEYCSAGSCFFAAHQHHIDNLPPGHTYKDPGIGEKPGSESSSFGPVHLSSIFLFAMYIIPANPNFYNSQQRLLCLTRSSPFTCLFRNLKPKDLLCETTHLTENFSLIMSHCCICQHCRLDLPPALRNIITLLVGLFCFQRECFSMCRVCVMYFDAISSTT